MNIKDMVKDNKKVKFVFYKQNELWYETECGFKFPVPISDIGDAKFEAADKALLFMRWIKKYIKEIESAQLDIIIQPLVDKIDGDVLETLEAKHEKIRESNRAFFEFLKKELIGKTYPEVKNFIPSNIREFIIYNDKGEVWHTGPRMPLTGFKMVLSCKNKVVYKVGLKLGKVEGLYSDKD